MELEQVREELRANTDEKYREGNMRTVPTSRKGYGIRNAVLIKITKKVYKECGLDLFAELIDSDWLEEQMMAVRLLGFACKKNPEETYELSLKHLEEIRDWCTCDTLATQSLRKYSLKNQSKTLDLASKGVENKNFWIRRFWIASLVPLCLKKNKGSADVDKILEVLDKVMLDKEKYVQKAIHWVLREVTWRDENKVLEFIKRWLGKAPRSTLWQGSEKLRSELREQLR
jgi:3-methyladenine DNA glycosylase AlkD